MNGIFRLCAVSALIGSLNGWAAGRPQQLHLVGDSTLFRRSEAAKEGSWGEALGRYLGRDRAILNWSLCGKTTVSIEPSWTNAALAILPGDAVIFQFGINDADSRKFVDERTFKARLGEFVDAVRARGAYPLVCSPLAAMGYDRDDAKRGYRPTAARRVYADYAKALAAEKGADFVDMTELTERHLRAVGRDAAKKLFCGDSKMHGQYWFDDTHPTKSGADAFAKLFTDEVLARRLPLAAWLTREPKDETAAWQAAIDRVAAAGGGRVTVTAGAHEVGQLFLRSGVELHLAEGAELLGLPGTNHYTQTVLPCSEGTWGAVVYAHQVTNVAITGRGTIDGRGALWPHTGFRPRGLFFSDSAQIRLEDFTFRDSANWGIAVKRCDGVTVRRLIVSNHANDNNDGIDLEARNVVVADSEFDAGDDAICIKSNDPDFTVGNILVTNCVARSHCNGLKLGTASHGTMRNIRFFDCRTDRPLRTYVYRGGNGNRKGGLCFYWSVTDEFPIGVGIGAINVECVDGGRVEDVLFDGIRVDGFKVPIFVRGARRLRRSTGVPPGRHRILRDVTIRNVRGVARSAVPSSVTGAGGCEPKGVSLENVEIVCRADAVRPICEPSALYDGKYPEADMFRRLRLPAYGLYVDRAEVALRKVSFRLPSGCAESRPPVYRSTAESQARRARPAADPFVGTQGLGNVTPAAAYPFGLVQAGPDTSSARERFLPNKGHCGGYQHDDRWIWRFSQTHISGTGCASFGDFGIMPYVGAWNPETAALALEKRQEAAMPGYYAVGVRSEGGIVRCEMTALEHTAVYRFRYPEPQAGAARLLIDLDWGIGTPGLGGSWGKRIANCRFERRGETLLGGHDVWNWNDYSLNFALKASAPIVRVETIREPKGIRGGIYAVEFGKLEDNEVVVRLALSTTSPEAAERNLLAEAPVADFELALDASVTAWWRRLGLIELGAGTDPRVRTGFATALYRLFFQPNRQSDVGELPTYSTFSLWDTFRAAHPFYSIFAPEENAAFVRSMLDQYDRQGYLPIWALGGSENHCMIGHHAVPVVVDAFLKGRLASDDVERAYRAVKDSLTRNHKPVNEGTWGLLKEDWDILDRYGYYPFDRMRGEYRGRKVRGESVARTYECAYDDACAARFAAALGKAEDASFFARRAGNWRNVFDASIGYARGKDSQGRWREPFNRYDCGSGPWTDNDFCEGGSCQYTWHVMHDPEGLVAALGGKAKAGARLDLLFSDKAPDANDRGFNYDIAGCIGQYVHGNEPSHHIAYLYAYTDRPENVGPIIRKIFDTKYGTTPDGLCGNDDCGQMSAWYVFSALGFYPVDPCGGTYVLGAPQVPEATLCLPGGKTLRIVVCESSDADGPCRARLNGISRTEPFLRHAEIADGGLLVVERGDFKSRCSQ